MAIDIKLHCNIKIILTSEAFLKNVIDVLNKTNRNSLFIFF